MYDVVFNSGFIGLLIWILLFSTSTAAIAIAIRCAWSLRAKHFYNAKIQQYGLNLLKEHEWQKAYELYEVNQTILAHIIAPILLSAHQTNTQKRQEQAMEIMNKNVREILRKMNVLATCANIAPMLGLLGTVTGMVDAFMGLGTAMGPEKASVLAISISQALYTTAAGLLIAVPAIVLGVYFRNQLERRLETVKEAVEEVLEKLPEGA